MEFSLLGLGVSLAVFAPTLLLLVFPPHEARPLADIPWPLAYCERLGQIGCIVAPALTGAHHGTGPAIVVLVLAISAYYTLWIRYLLRGQKWPLLYRPVGGVRVPLAVAPVVYFFAAAAWLSSWWIAAAATILALGHIPASLLIAHAVPQEGRSS